MKEIILIIVYVLIGFYNGGLFAFAGWSDNAIGVRVVAVIMAAAEIIFFRWFINLIFSKT